MKAQPNRVAGAGCAFARHGAFARKVGFACRVGPFKLARTKCHAFLCATEPNRYCKAADCQRPLLRRGIASRLHGGLGVQEPVILGGLHYRADQVFVSINFCFLKMFVIRKYAERFVAILLLNSIDLGSMNPSSSSSRVYLGIASSLRGCSHAQRCAITL